MENTRKYKILYLVMALLSLPLCITIARPREWTVTSLAGYFSAILGYLGVVMLFVMFILGSRSFFGYYFKNSPKILRLHSLLGKYGTIFIFLHPILIALWYGENWFKYAFQLNFSSASESAISFGRISLILLITVYVSSALLRDQVRYRGWKLIHWLSYIALPMALIHMHKIGSNNQNALVRFEWLVISMVTLLIFILRFRTFFGFGKSKYQIVENDNLNNEIKLLKLKYISGARINPEVGQFIQLSRRLIGEEHPFSNAGYDEGSGDVIIVYKIYGRFTKRLAQEIKGKNLYLDGAYGVFLEKIQYKINKRPVVFIAGGGLELHLFYLLSIRAYYQV